MPAWTERQRQAITARNPEILVSAAAGSGKTAVLIQRVMSLLEEGLQLDRMLVVTFTHAAADEMKERLTELLSAAAQDSAHLRAQFSLLGRADISTLHSFCMRLLRTHFQAADTDPLSKMADEALARELFDQALDQALDAFHEAPTEEGLGLAACFTEEQLIEMVRQLHNFLMSKDAPEAWLQTMLEEGSQARSLYDTPWYEVMAREAGLMLRGARGLLEAALELCLRPDGPERYEEAIRDDLTMVASLLERLSQPGFTWSKPAFTRLPSKKPPAREDPALALRVKDVLRQQAKDLITGALALLPRDYDEAASWAEQVEATRSQLRALAALTQHTQENYRALKAARALWDFHDLEHLALKALGDERVRAELSGSYDAIFVDEYQDVSQIQEAVIQRLRAPHNSLFMVGDVKQSIYRFRLADPSLFLGKHRGFLSREDAPARLITLKENFRSGDNILKAVNLVFERAMRRDATEIDYDEEASLVSGLEGVPGQPVELWLLEKDLAPEEDDALLIDEPEETPLEEPEETEEEEDGGRAPAASRGGEMERAFVYEARLIARRVAQLVGTPIRDGEGTRELQFRDIAILLRTASRRAGVMAEILSAAGIPAYSDAEGEFYTQSDVRDALPILQVLDNPLQDVPLLSALSCPAFGFTPEELARLRLEAASPDQPLHESFASLALRDPRFMAAEKRLARWRLMASAMPLERFMSQMLRESGLYAIAGAKEEGRLRRANLRLLAARAMPLPEPQNLADFVERALRSVRQQARDRSASLGMQENVVRIMTMHKSKGLQFPVVFLPDLAAAFSLKRPSQPLRLDARMGLALEQVNPVLRTRNEGFAMRALKTQKNREELSEEARLLYVGMTRARERLILIGAPDSLDGALGRWSLPLGDYAAGSARSMLDWVAAPLYPALKDRREGLYEAPNGSRWALNWRGVSSLKAGPLTTPALEAVPETEGDEQPRRDLFKPLLTTAPLPQKSSVTALVTKAARLLEEEEETPQLKRRELPEQALLQPARRPGIASLSAARRGAAAHKALCALDPARFVALDEPALDKALKEAADGLQQRGLLSREEREGLDLSLLARFYQSGLARRMAGSKQRQAEWPFTLLSDGQLILQGVLDSCFLEDGAWVLVDYKTDWGDPQELLARYSGQMRWYMRALRDITLQPVKEAWLYLLRRGEAVAVTEAAPISLDDFAWREDMA